jgi:hypothetical protein
MDSSNLLAHEVEKDELCFKCGLKPAQPGSELCLGCRLEIHKSLGDAAIDVGQKIVEVQRRPESYLKGVSARTALEMKRQRTGTHRFDPSPKQRKR